MFNKLVGILVLAVLSASAQTCGGNECISSCIQQALPSSTCSSQTDIHCICNDSKFQSAAASCIYSKCPGQLQAALKLQQEMCSASQCISDCVNQSAPKAACGTQDIKCICSDSTFTNAASQCVMSNCPDQADNARQIQQDMCSMAGACTPPPSPPSSSPSSPPPSSSPSNPGSGSSGGSGGNSGSSGSGSGSSGGTSGSSGSSSSGSSGSSSSSGSGPTSASSSDSSAAGASSTSSGYTSSGSASSSHASTALTTGIHTSVSLSHTVSGTTTGTVSGSPSARTGTGNSAAPAVLVSAPGAAFAAVIGLAGVVYGAFAL
ncbi:hypothetical protein VKT23_008465 [Stygiomarasmius scandens]|uniref:CFEM domain-containing protein n=1 Tax=Marasmiellus scandens TaxID=2682957 RepID=A0ABR1JGI3_9AGAR